MERDYIHKRVELSDPELVLCNKISTYLDKNNFVKIGNTNCYVNRDGTGISLSIVGSEGFKQRKISIQIATPKDSGFLERLLTTFPELK